MTHRADQIIAAVAAAVQTQAGGSGVKVYTHRASSLAADQDELPAYSVDYGEDRPGEILIAQVIRSQLEVLITAVVAGAVEEEVRTELLRLRREAHRAILSDATQGLAFVLDTQYGGAAPPEFQDDGDKYVGALTSAWLVHYEMQYTDPGD